MRGRVEGGSHSRMETVNSNNFGRGITMGTDGIILVPHCLVVLSTHCSVGLVQTLLAGWLVALLIGLVACWSPHLSGHVSGWSHFWMVAHWSVAAHHEGLAL